MEMKSGGKNHSSSLQDSTLFWEVWSFALTALTQSEVGGHILCYKDDIIVGGISLAVKHMKMDKQCFCHREAICRLLFVLFALGFLCVS